MKPHCLNSAAVNANFLLPSARNIFSMMRGKHFALFVIQLLLIPFLSFSQKGILLGKISDSKSNEALVGVTISAGKNAGTVSDADGDYKLDLETGTYLLTFSYLGYETQQREIPI